MRFVLLKRWFAQADSTRFLQLCCRGLREIKYRERVCLPQPKWEPCLVQEIRKEGCAQVSYGCSGSGLRRCPRGTHHAFLCVPFATTGGEREGLYTPLQRLLCPRSPYNNKNSRQNVHVLRFRLFQKATYHCSHNLRCVFGRTERLETPTEKWKGVKDHLNDRNL